MKESSSLRKRSYRKESELPRIPLAELEPIEQMTVIEAVKVRKNAYAPYSNDYKVGAAVVSVSDQIYTGVNVENALFKVPHAEENALSEMAKAGERHFKILICVAKNGGIPCLACRQVMREFSGPDLDEVIVIGVAAENNPKTDVTRVTFGELVGVDSFGPEDLNIDPAKH